MEGHLATHLDSSGVELRLVDSRQEEPRLRPPGLLGSLPFASPLVEPRCFQMFGTILLREGLQISVFFVSLSLSGL